MILGLLGEKFSGKTTGADYLVDRYKFVEIAFADCLKRACQELFLFANEQVYGTLEQKETPDERWFGCTPRTALQFVGTDLLRNNLDKIMPGLGKGIFTHHVKLRVEQLISKDPDAIIVISDVRFQNEVNFIHSLGGTVLKIHRQRDRIPENYDKHVSEVELSAITNFDKYISNNGDVEDFYDKIDGFIQNDFLSHLRKY